MSGKILLPDPRFRSLTAVAGKAEILSVFKRILSTELYNPHVDSSIQIIGVEPTEDYAPPGIGERLDPMFDLGVLVPTVNGKPQGEFPLLFMMDRSIGVSVTMHPLIENVTKSIEGIAADLRANPDKYTPDQIKGVFDVGLALIKEIGDQGKSALTAKVKVPILLARNDVMTFEVRTKPEFKRTKSPSGSLVIYVSAMEKGDVR